MGAGANGNRGSKTGGKTTGSTNTGSRAPSSSPRPREAPKGSMTKNASGQKTYTDTKTGKTSPAPKFGAASLKGLTSKDPGNVARNRAGAAKYSSMSERMAASNRDTNVDKAAAMAAARAVRPAAPAPVMASKVAPTTAAPRPGMMATKPPAGYRPGIDPEFNYRSATPGAATTPMAPRVTPTVGLGGAMASSAGRGLAGMMAKGGKTKPKGKKK